MFLILTLLILLTRNHMITGWTTQTPDARLQGPVFLSEPPSSLVFANTKGAFVPCTAFGLSAPVLEWIKGEGLVVDEIPGLLKIHANNTLEFLSFEDDQFQTDIHTQTYRCRATNEAGTIISRPMQVKSVLIDDYKSYNLQLNDVWAMKGGTAIFKCNINPFFVNDYISIVSWTQGTKSISAGERVSIFPNGKLQIRDIRDEDRYTTYRCVARNIFTKEEKVSTFAYLHVHEPPTGWSPPKIEDYTKVVTVNHGTTVELSCVGSGNPLPEYRWSFEGKDVVIDNTLFSQKGGNLVVKNAMIDNSGKYSCNVSNPHGISIVTTQLIVTLPLSAHINPSVQTVDSGQSANLNCSIDGYPVKSITWYRNGIQLFNNDRLRIDNSTYLTIQNVNRMDQAMYQCIIQNANDAAQGSAHLLLGVAEPAFVETFNTKYVQIGQKTSFRCVAAGNPTPNISWTLDGQPIPTVNEIKQGTFTNRLGDVISYVNISSVKLEYGGEYSCCATNDIGKNIHEDLLNVYGIPMVKKMRNITATANKALVIKCYVAGYPVSTVTWSKDGIKLPQNHLQHVVDRELTIDKVQKKKDSGEYVCTAKNSNGQGSSQSLHVAVVDPPVVDPFSFPVKKQGDRIVVSCVVSSGDQPIKVRWLKDDKEIPPDMAIKIQHIDTFTNMLIIGDASTKHSGNYTCEASNLVATVRFTSYLQVDVPPTWVNEPEDSFVILGNSVILDCLTSGLPQPKLTWKKASGASSGTYSSIPYVEDDNALSSRLQLLSNGTLVIRNASETDDGHYLCHADNSVGYPLSKVILLTVHIPARFDEPSKNYSVNKYQNITMDCQAVGDKPLAVTWSFNGKIFVTTSRKTIQKIYTDRGLLSRLILSPSERQDTGFYVCNAKNKFGSGVLSMRLTVKERPEAPRNVTVSSLTSRQAKVRWKKPYDGNTNILFYIVEYTKQTESRTTAVNNITVPGSDTSATLTKLHPSYTYQVRVRANNSVGIGEPSSSIIVDMMEEAPSGPPTNIEVRAIGSEALQITWMPPAEEHINGELKGYYIGYKEAKSPARFIYITKTIGINFKPLYILHHLAKFTEYAIHIQAFNDKGRGPSSPEYKVFTLEDVPSQPPEGVQATSINSRSIKIIWSPPPLYTLNGILQGYKILYQPVRDDEDERDANTLTTSNIETIITGLSKFTNYSIQVLAYTRKGEGVRSQPLYVTTQEDVPERPADIKALPINSSSILVSWMPPLHSNGRLTRYNVYVVSSNSENEMHIELTPTNSTYILTNVIDTSDYKFQVSANTIMGEGERTPAVSASVHSLVAARIASFSKELTVAWHYSVLLNCIAVGCPLPKVTWKIRNKYIIQNERIQILKNGSLFIDTVIGSDASNYTCHAENKYGSDQIVYALSVQVSNSIGTPPKPPLLYIVASTSSTIQVSWKSGSNGGSPIKGFSLKYKKDHEDWKHVMLGSTNRSYTASGLLCGTSYKFIVFANNKHGESQDSNTITAKTNGTMPIMPPQSMLLSGINTTSVDLDMTSWLTSGCPITFYSVKYKVYGDNKWTEVANHIKSNITLFRVLDLLPATWYTMIVTANSDAGSTESDLKFSTLTYKGESITPVYISHKYEKRFYEKEIVMIPLCAGVVSISVLIVGVLLYCKRRRDILRLKEISSNLRRDITAETSLMNDLDKKLNSDYDSSSGHSDVFNKRNVNLLASLNSDDNILGHSPSWLFNSDTSKTNSENGSLSKSDEDGNINPYATFNEMHQMLRDNNAEMDDISLEKAAARKMMQMDPYVPFYKQKRKYPEKLAPIPPVKPPPSDGYDNEGLALSPRKYASADQIHSLFTTSGQRPQHIYGKVRHNFHNMSEDKGSLRHSIISSITTVSSSRDELLEALENAKVNPPPPVLYESHQDDSSELTESPGELGILQFTQSPPHPNEEREATCQVRSHGGIRSQSKGKQDLESLKGSRKKDTPYLKKSRVKHKPKQRGQTTTRSQVKRTPSKVSTTSSEEVTYTFEDCDYPHSLSEGYFSYPHNNRSETDNSMSSNASGHWKTAQVFNVKCAYDSKEKWVTAIKCLFLKGKRLRYDVKQHIPSFEDSKKPIPDDCARSRDDEEAVRLLDRHYRPLDLHGHVVLEDRQTDKGYTDDFTLV